MGLIMSGADWLPFACSAQTALSQNGSIAPDISFTGSRVVLQHGANVGPFARVLF